MKKAAVLWFAIILQAYSFGEIKMRPIEAVPAISPHFGRRDFICGLGGNACYDGNTLSKRVQTG